MTRRIVGEKVGVILGADPVKKIVKYLGYGTYQGDQERPPEGIGGFNIGLPGPKIVLDNGDVVWGCECWWGSAQGIKEQLEIYRASGFEVVKVSIADERKQVAISD